MIKIIIGPTIGDTEVKLDLLNTDAENLRNLTTGDRIYLDSLRHLLVLYKAYSLQNHTLYIFTKEY